MIGCLVLPEKGTAPLLRLPGPAFLHSCRASGFLLWLSSRVRRNPLTYRITPPYPLTTLDGNGTARLLLSHPLILNRSDKASRSLCAIFSSSGLSWPARNPRGWLAFPLFRIGVALRPQRERAFVGWLVLSSLLFLPCICRSFPKRTRTIVLLPISTHSRSAHYFRLPFFPPLLRAFSSRNNYNR